MPISKMKNVPHKIKIKIFNKFGLPKNMALKKIFNFNFLRERTFFIEICAFCNQNKILDFLYPI
jgi:hypothetical protein